MKPEGSLVAEGVAALHCAELLRGPRQALDPLKALTQLGVRLEELLTEEMPMLCGGAKPIVTVAAPSDLQASGGNENAGQDMFSSLMSVGPKAVVMATSLSRDTILNLVDIAFGGKGSNTGETADGAAKSKLPMSALLTFHRFEQLLARVLAEALDLPETNSIKLLNQDSGPEARVPFAGCKRSVLPIRIALDGADPWDIQFTFPPATLAALFSGRDPAKRSPANSPPPPRDPAAGPLGAIPLPLTAVLVDMDVPVSLLSRLKPGMVIPVSVARNVPLYAGEHVLARGSVGAVDDLAALQLTKITTIQEN